MSTESVIEIRATKRRLRKLVRQSVREAMLITRAEEAQIEQAFIEHARKHAEPTAKAA